MVVFARNPVHSVLWLILAFFSAAGLFVMMGAEFLAMLLMIVYVGAVAVLFLFVVMMLDVDFAELRGRVAEYLPIGLAIGVVLIMQLSFGFLAWQEVDSVRPASEISRGVGNAHMIGEVIYTKYVYAFQASGMILLVAMIGAIVLTLRQREGVKKQSVLAQMYRDPNTAVELHDVKPGGTL
ncbi:UNVERIFIED_CONTAM: hypothetical protein GTU68_013338 [Idotea baltica]|nr:hypothetical protein [Idotea baltica]